MTRVWYNKSFSFVYNIVQLIKKQDQAQQFCLIVSHTQAHARGLLVADESYLEPTGLGGKAYVDWCVDFCRQHHIDIFVVGKGAESIAKHQVLFTEIGVKLVLVADAHTLHLLNDKSLFAQQLPSHIATLPETVTVQSLAAFEQAYQEMRSRHACLSVKPAISIFGLGFRKIDEENDSLQHILSGKEYVIGLEELRQAMSRHTQFGNLLLMEFLGGDEWSVDCVAIHGQLYAAVQRRKFMGNKSVPCQYIDNNADIARMCQQLTAHFVLNGQFNIQFRAGANGIKLLEINARPSGGMAMSCLAGVNLPYLVLLSCISPERLPPVCVNVGQYVGDMNIAVALPNK